MVSTLYVLLVAASGLLSPPKDAVSQYAQDYESQYQNDLKKRMAMVDGQEDSQVRDPGLGEADAPAAADAPAEAEEAPAAETPAEETPAEETPAEETRAAEDPAEETPAEETPAAEDPAEETPAEETPANVTEEAHKLSSDAESAATDQELAEHHQELDHLLTESLEKLKASSKMMVVLHVLMKPVAEKLKVSMEKMPEAQKVRSMAILHHMEALDELSEKSVAMLSDVSHVEEGTDAERAAGVKHLMTEMKEIQDGVKLHLAAMKSLPHEDHADTEAAPEESHAPALREPRKLKPMTTKLHALLAKMKAKVDKELADPALKDDPKTAVDMQMYDVMSKSIKKSEALIVVASMLLKKAATPEAKQKIKVAIQEEMHNTMLALKADMKHLKEKTVMLAAIKEMKAQAAKHGLPTEVHDPEADEEEHAAPAQDRHEEQEWSIPHHHVAAAAGSESDETSDGPDEKKSDTPIDQDAPSQKKAETSSDQDIPEETKSDETTDKKSDELADTDAEAKPEAKAEESSFMKKLEDDLKKFRDHASIRKDKKDDIKGERAGGMNDDSDAPADQKDRDSAPEEPADGLNDDSDAPADQNNRDSAPEEAVTDDAKEPNTDEADDANDASEPTDEVKEPPPQHASHKHKHSDRKFEAVLDELDDLKGSFKTSPHDPNLRSDGGH